MGNEEVSTQAGLSSSTDPADDATLVDRAGQAGRHDSAAELIRQAISVALAFHPTMPETFVRRGSALLALGRPDEAVASHVRALALRADVAEALPTPRSGRA